MTTGGRKKQQGANKKNKFNGLTGVRIVIASILPGPLLSFVMGANDLVHMSVERWIMLLAPVNSGRMMPGPDRS